MAFNLNGFNFNHSVLDALGRPVLTYADIVNRATLAFSRCILRMHIIILLLLAINNPYPSEVGTQKRFFKRGITTWIFYPIS